MWPRSQCVCDKEISESKQTWTPFCDRMPVDGSTYDEWITDKLTVPFPTPFVKHVHMQCLLNIQTEIVTLFSWKSHGLLVALNAVASLNNGGILLGEGHPENIYRVWPVDPSFILGYPCEHITCFTSACVEYVCTLLLISVWIWTKPPNTPALASSPGSPPQAS